jgi:DNA modification methylase
MQVELWPIERVKPYEGNPRLNQDAVEAVCVSIREFGWQQPLVVDRDGVIIVGHTRRLAAIKLGLTEVPVVVADLPPEKARAYRIADNQTATIADWDLQKLPIELFALEEDNFDLALLGFSAEELAKLMGQEVSDGECDPDDVPEPPDEAVTQPGDLWVLGRHRLLCGDSSKAEDVDRLLNGAPIHLVNSDPPYNVKVEPRSNNAIAAGLSSFSGPKHHQNLDLARHPGKSKPTGKLRAKDRPLANDFVTDEQFDVLLDAWFGNFSRVLEPGRSFYIWGGYANCANYPPFLKKHDLYFSQAIIWDKQHPVLTRKDFMGAHEWCQPAGTVVSTPTGLASIETLSDGDKVISYDPSTSTLREAAIRVTSRFYDGPLYQVHCAGESTWCTPEHLWTTRLVGSDKPFVASTLDIEPEAMELPIPNGQSIQWRYIDDVKTDLYIGRVYSMEVAHDQHYIADGIVTHNCFYGWKLGAGHKFYGPNNVTDLWHVKKIPPQQMQHLTAKPAELAVLAMQYSSVLGENVLDLFGGSGSTLIGAEQCGRNAFLMELDALYCDVIVQRYQSFTGKPAILERTGDSPIPLGQREEAMR